MKIKDGAQNLLPTLSRIEVCIKGIVRVGGRIGNIFIPNIFSIFLSVASLLFPRKNGSSFGKGYSLLYGFSFPSFSFLPEEKKAKPEKKT
ncbi:hypothetical protein [Oribacterium sp.]